MRSAHLLASAMIVGLAVSSCNRAGAPDPSSAFAAREQSEPDDRSFVEELERDPALAPFFRRAPELRLQILVARPERTPEGGTVLVRHAFRADRDYFYPASAVKLCAAVGALEKLAELDAADVHAAIGPDTTLRLSYDDAVVETTVAVEVMRALVVSDNEAYNRLFDFVGRNELGGRMARLGLTSAVLTNRLAARDRALPIVELVTSDGAPRLVAERTDLAAALPSTDPVLVGEAHLDHARHVVDAPMDFAGKNRMSLHDLQDLLAMVVRPDLWSTPGPQLDKAGRSVLLEALAALPSEVMRGRRRSADRMHKPLYDVISSRLPGHSVRVLGKGGRAFGFFVENSYVIDETTGASFFLSAAVYANDNDVVNDDRYDYEKVALPFVRRLGALLAERWLVPADG